MNSGSLIYASTAYEGDEGGVFVASGAGWRRVTSSSAFGSTNVHSLAAGPKRLFASNAERVFQSVDGGRLWTALPARPPEAVLSMASIEEQLWIGTRLGVYRQSAQGWQAVPGVIGPIRSLRRAGTKLLASSDQSVSVSSDLGLTWRKLDAQGLFDAAISCQGSVLLATASRLMFAPPGKAPEASQGIPEGTVSAVVFHPLRCQEAYAAQFGKLYRSSDAGAHWNPVEGVTSLSSISRFWLTEATPDWLFATVPGSGIFRQRLP